MQQKPAVWKWGHLAIKCLRLCSSWSTRGSSTQDTGLFIPKLVCLGTEINSAKGRLTFPQRNRSVGRRLLMSKKFYEPIKVTAFFSHIQVTDVKEWRARNHVVTVGSKFSPVF